MFGKFGVNYKLKQTNDQKSIIFPGRLGDPWGKQGDLCHIREIPG